MTQKLSSEISSESSLGLFVLVQHHGENHFTCSPGSFDFVFKGIISSNRLTQILLEQKTSQYFAVFQSMVSLPWFKPMPCANPEYVNNVGFSATFHTLVYKHLIRESMPNMTKKTYVQSSTTVLINFWVTLKLCVRVWKWRHLHRPVIEMGLKSYSFLVGEHILFRKRNSTAVAVQKQTPSFLYLL